MKVLVAPEAVLLDIDAWQKVMMGYLEHAATRKDCFLIIDIPGGARARTGGNDDVVSGTPDGFRTRISGNSLEFGAAYYPWLTVTGTTPDMPKHSLPPSSAMAGIYARIDRTRGPHRAPANTEIIGVSALATDIDNAATQDLNAPPDGKAVNAIRAFAGRGILPWGARTLNGNSPEWRYISVRRMVMEVEHAISEGLATYQHRPNAEPTWRAIEADIAAYLSDLWRQGALSGATQDEAFLLALGLGQTMTPEDISAGILRVRVGLAVSRPAEFVVVSFAQEMIGAR